MRYTILAAIIAALAVAGCRSAPKPGPQEGAVWVTQNVSIFPGEGGVVVHEAPVHRKASPAKGASFVEIPEPCKPAALAPASFVDDCPGGVCEVPTAKYATGGTGDGRVVLIGLGILFAIGACIQFGWRQGSAVGLAVLLLSCTVGCASISGLASEDDLDHVVKEERAVDKAKADTFNAAIAEGLDPAAATARALGAYEGVRTPRPEGGGVSPLEGVAGGVVTLLLSYFGINAARNRKRRLRGEPVESPASGSSA